MVVLQAATGEFEAGANQTSNICNGYTLITAQWHAVHVKCVIALDTCTDNKSYTAPTTSTEVE